METEREVRSTVSLMPLAHLAMLLIEKGVITQDKFKEKIKAERATYQAIVSRVT